MDPLIFERASVSGLSDKWNDDDDLDVLADGEVVGRLFKANAAPVGVRPALERSVRRYLRQFVSGLSPCLLWRAVLFAW